MFKIIQKMVILWEKSKFLTLMEMETDYLKKENGEILSRDTDYLRTKLGELKQSKDAKSSEMSSEIQRQVIDIEAEINETEKFRQMMQTSKAKSEDLKKQLKLYREGLWR